MRELTVLLEDPDDVDRKMRNKPGLAIALLILSAFPGTYAFNFFCGCLFQDPATVAVDTLARLNTPPVISYPVGDPPINVTLAVSTLGTRTAYQYWFLWGPTTSHPANEWEPVYLVWDTGNPTMPSLAYVMTRFHFLWRITGGSGISLNGTQATVSFGVDFAGSRFHVATVRAGGLLGLVKSQNITTSVPFSIGPTLPATSPTWYYPLVNGGSHNVLLVVDQNSPYSAGPQAYQNDASGNGGPTDPFQGRNIAFALFMGAAAAVGFYIMVSVGIIEERMLRKWTRRR